jgi:hypothetical protein
MFTRDAQGSYLTRGLAVLAVLTALSSCGTDPDPIYAQAFGFQCANSDSAIADIACVNRPAGGNEHVSRYCYATIGSSNCFDRPDQDRKNQALGSSGY